MGRLLENARLKGESSVVGGNTSTSSSRKRQKDSACRKKMGLNCIGLHVKMDLRKPALLVGSHPAETLPLLSIRLSTLTPTATRNCRRRVPVALRFDSWHVLFCLRCVRFMLFCMIYIMVLREENHRRPPASCTPPASLLAAAGNLSNRCS